MKVKELVEELKKYNQDAELTVGDNFDNGISISYGVGAEGETKENCKFVCFCEGCKHSQVYYNFDLEEECICGKFGCSDEGNKAEVCNGKFKEDV